MTLSFWNIDKSLNSENDSIRMPVGQKQFYSLVCDHFHIDQSTNKFQVIKVVQENDDNNKAMYVVHTLVHPPHGETVTKELMSNRVDNYSSDTLIGKLKSKFQNSIRSITLGHFGTEVMNPKWNRVYASASGKPGGTFWSGAIDRGGKPYYCPKGWKRYALKVTDNEAEFDQRWSSWHIAYHGTKGTIAAAILESSLKVSTSGCYLKRPSVYVSPSIEYSAHPRYSSIWQKSGITSKYCQLVFQCRVNPRLVTKDNVHKETLYHGQKLIDANFTNEELEWLIPGSNSKDEYITQDIVCYGIMIRVSDVHPSNLPSSHWWGPK
ncbi:unnamed protein product [Rotaria socialis]|uniref:Uncharacterized protein n=1 Tax=Rotaria socialis TaxID=392032 RepID=A0A820XUX5_9BILA|nr:unnamed protein product [Rotaria socialis]CAF3414968.1 unnamed protein product [Rotaria socialis]CAF3588278.1 unnamed protein product [Rotaria socialis]CAF4226739.1 unnamed protein product [Rotaria socialis]CAF4366768.1 unnamed protein product [Rotaria socialis]